MAIIPDSHKTFGRARKGMTLIELLIVLTLVAILTGIVMLVGAVSLDKMEATRIINDLRNIKSAAIICCVEEKQFPTSSRSLDKYIERGAKYDGTEDYIITQVSQPKPNGERTMLVGIRFVKNISGGVAHALLEKFDLGLFDSDGNPYTGNRAEVYVDTHIVQ